MEAWKETQEGIYLARAGAIPSLSLCQGLLKAPERQACVILMGGGGSVRSHPVVHEEMSHNHWPVLQRKEWMM